MASFVEYGPDSKAIYALSGPKKSGYYAMIATGFRGSIKRPKPKDLLRSMTGHSSSRTQREAVNFSVPSPDPLYPGTDFLVSQVAQVAVGDNVGNGAVEYSAKLAAQREADAKILIRLKSQKWNAATSLVELGQTMNFLTTSVKELFDYYRLARKGDFLRLSELYRQRDQRGKRYPPWPVRVSNRYLAYRFAVRPLVGDIDGAINTLIQSQVKPSIRSVSASTTRSGYKFQKEPNWQGNPAFPVHYGASETYACRRRIYYEVSPDVQQWKSLGFTNLASVLWEVTPYSFMVDQVLPIGQFISNLDAAFGVGLIADYRAEYLRGEAFRSIRDGYVRAKNESYARSISLGLPLPTAVFSRSPSAQTFGDALALLVQIRNRPPKGGF